MCFNVLVAVGLYNTQLGVERLEIMDLVWVKFWVGKVGLLLLRIIQNI